MINRSSFNRLICLIFLPVFVLFSCNTYKSVQISNAKIGTDFNKSFKTWNTLKKIHHNSYTYHVNFSSWIGYSNTTKIVVKNGKVISREYLETQRSDRERYKDEETKIYEENASNLNTNEKGFKGVTMDQVYTDCGTKSLQADEDENNLYFTVDDLGIVKACGFAIKNCADDCSEGVYISKFKWLE